jgi:hypothetical protein
VTARSTLTGHARERGQTKREVIIPSLGRSKPK